MRERERETVTLTDIWNARRFSSIDLVAKVLKVHIHSYYVSYTSYLPVCVILNFLQHTPLREREREREGGGERETGE